MKYTKGKKKTKKKQKQKQKGLKYNKYIQY